MTVKMMMQIEESRGGAIPRSGILCIRRCSVSDIICSDVEFISNCILISVCNEIRVSVHILVQYSNTFEYLKHPQALVWFLHPSPVSDEFPCSLQLQ